jgi:hypothetical protein
LGSSERKRNADRGISSKQSRFLAGCGCDVRACARHRLARTAKKPAQGGLLEEAVDRTGSCAALSSVVADILLVAGVGFEPTTFRL